MKCTLRYIMVFLAVFIVFVVSGFLANYVLLWSGCIWTSSASFGVSFIAGLGIALPSIHALQDLTHLF